ncbi:hypothetical protein BGZ60DRAFT_415807 [Tricladium varicosporioides]|nr:hypothetical protein BGZ60DRAFT_415807 [Hymenoscyphus varicosporioides]
MFWIRLRVSVRCFGAAHCSRAGFACLRQLCWPQIRQFHDLVCIFAPIGNVCQFLRWVGTGRLAQASVGDSGLGDCCTRPALPSIRGNGHARFLFLHIDAFEQPNCRRY